MIPSRAEQSSNTFLVRTITAGSVVDVGSSEEVTGLVADDTDAANVGAARTPEGGTDVILPDESTSARRGPVLVKIPLVTPDPTLGGQAGVAVGFGGLGTKARVDDGDGIDLAVVVGIKIRPVDGVGNIVEGGTDGHANLSGHAVVVVSDLGLGVGDVDPVGDGGYHVEGIVRVEEEAVTNRAGRSQYVVATNLVEEAVIKYIAGMGHMLEIKKRIPGTFSARGHNIRVRELRANIDQFTYISMSALEGRTRFS